MSDVTIEKMAELLATAAPKGLLITRDELAGWFQRPGSLQRRAAVPSGSKAMAAGFTALSARNCSSRSSRPASSSVFMAAPNPTRRRN